MLRNAAVLVLSDEDTIALVRVAGANVNFNDDGCAEEAGDMFCVVVSVPGGGPPFSSLKGTPMKRHLILLVAMGLLVGACGADRKPTQAEIDAAVAKALETTTTQAPTTTTVPQTAPVSEQSASPAATTKATSKPFSTTTTAARVTTITTAPGLSSQPPVRPGGSPTLENYNKIQVGMWENEVISLLGPPETESSRDATSATLEWTGPKGELYRDSAWILVYIQNGRVTRKSQSGLGEKTYTAPPAPTWKEVFNKSGSSPGGRTTFTISGISEGQQVRITVAIAPMPGYDFSGSEACSANLGYDTVMPTTYFTNRQEKTITATHKGDNILGFGTFQMPNSRNARSGVPPPAYKWQAKVEVYA